MELISIPGILFQLKNALVEIITSSDDSYWRLEHQRLAVNGKIFIRYERHQNGALLIAGDQDEGMSFSQIYAVLSYGGGRIVKWLAVRREARGYFGRGMKQAIRRFGAWLD